MHPAAGEKKKAGNRCRKNWHPDITSSISYHQVACAATHPARVHLFIIAAVPSLGTRGLSLCLHIAVVLRSLAVPRRHARAVARTLALEGGHLQDQVYY